MDRKFLHIAAFSVFLQSAAAFAAESVPVRLGTHDGYARIVFDWPSAAPYTVGQDSDSSLLVSFDRAAAADISGVSTDGTKQVSEVKQVSGTEEKLKIKIGLRETGTQFRHFNVGNRVVIDVFSPGQHAAATPPQQQKQAQEQEKTTAVSTPAKEVGAVPASAPGASAAAVPVADLSSKKEAEKKQEEKAASAADAKPDAVKVVEAAPEKTAIERAMQTIDPHVITVSLTESVGMAVFLRNGYFWIVFDRPDILTPPQIVGPSKNLFPSFSRHEIKGGVSFRMKMPENIDVKLYGEGGGLVWRIVVTPHERETKPVEMERIFVQGDYIRGGSAFWPLLQTRKILDLPDPGVGDILKIVTVDASSQFTGDANDFVDFDTMSSIVGMAIKPEADDLDVALTGNGVKIGRPGGLAMSRPKDVKRKKLREEVTESVIEAPKDPEQQMRRVYDFDRWMMGGLQALGQNQRILMANTVTKDKNGRVQDLLTLAKISVANDRGQEALGFLSYAADEIPELADGAEFIALRGASYALSGKYELAMQDFLSPQLKEYNELDYWRAYTLAWLEDWQHAKEAMPKDYSVLVGYPKALLEKLGIKLAEIALRDGDVGAAEKILLVLGKDRESLNPWTVAGLDYLKGEAHRQSAEYDNAVTLWETLSAGHDDFYRARSGLALTMLQLQTGKITRKDAIDRLEGLRYAWRGDELEAQINFMTGKLYIEDRQFLKGFGILRDAASLSPDSDVSKDIAAYMAESFKSIMLEDKNLTPLDAVTVYEQFRELTPVGDEGNRLIQKLAERLVEADLLGRAADILQHQVDYRLQGMEKARIAERLAAIYLLAKAPEKAIAAIDVAKPIFEQDSAPESKKSLHNIELMRARAMSQMDHTEEALALLAKFDVAPDVNRLRADIAWQAGLWEDAAEALQDMILDEALDLNRPLTDAQADLILNRAVALNLSGNRVALANMRKRYEDVIKKTSRSRLFDVVTRPRQSTLLSDRQTLDSLVSEVDIFKNFLDAYKGSGSASN